MISIKRNVLLNPGPATTTDTVKMAQIVPDICPREKEFGQIMKELSNELVRIVHGDPAVYTAVLFCGSGTINIDVCLSSLLPQGKKALIVNNGAYSRRAVEVCSFYGLPYIDLKFLDNMRPDLSTVEKALEDPDVALVYTTHHETGSGILNPIREIGALAHEHGALFVVDTTSSYAMIPIDIARDNIDFCMASAQKGIMAMAGLSFIVGRTAAIEASAAYPKRSYYCNLYQQYASFKKTGQMHFTPPVQTIYAAMQGVREYFAEGESAKWERHKRVFEAIKKGAHALGLRTSLPEEYESKLVACILYPDDPNWDFEAVHDYCYERGFTIYPGKIDSANTFRLCSLGAIDVPDIEAFFVVLKEAFCSLDIAIPARYKETGR